MKNYIVVHIIDGDQVSRFDFADNFDEALYCSYLLFKHALGSGLHEFIVLEEFSCVEYARYSCNIVGDRFE